jgi:glycosyltransferase involved in cell wall biosynthesis
VPGLPLISVIIPVYDVAAYLPECLDSILGPGGDIEVIAVDDASPDGCGALLADRAAADPRLHVIHLAVNGGPGAARNAGLARATGQYVWFVDADDRLADGALAAVRAALRGRPDGRELRGRRSLRGRQATAARRGRRASPVPAARSSPGCPRRAARWKASPR